MLCLLAGSCGRTEPLRFDDAFMTDAARPDAGLDAGFRFDAGTDPRVVDCKEGRFTLAHARPVVALVLDRSTSMNASFGTTTRWGAVRSALTRTLPSVDQSMQLGAMLFPASGNSCGAPAFFDIPPAQGTVTRIVALVNGANPQGSTPTALSLESAASGLLGRRTAGTARAMVLATDGAPDCNTQLPMPCTCVSGTSCSVTRCLDDVRTLERLRAAAAVAIPTFVIGIQDSTNTSLTAVLNRMAEAGGRPRAGAQKYYSATSMPELEQAFTTIRDQVGGCLFLTDSVPTIGDGGFDVSVDGQPVAPSEDGAEGWRWQDRRNGEVALLGAACSLALANPTRVEAVVRCPALDGGVPDGG